MFHDKTLSQRASFKQLLTLLAVTVGLLLFAASIVLPFTVYTARRHGALAGPARQRRAPSERYYPQPRLHAVYLAASVPGSLPDTDNLPPQRWNSAVTLYVIVAGQRVDIPGTGARLTYYCGDNNDGGDYPGYAKVQGQVVPLSRWQTSNGGRH